MNHEATMEEIRNRLDAALKPVEMEIINESHLHVGHPGAREGGHFRLRITSHRFNDLSMLQQHRLIYKTLDELMPGSIHALAIESAPADDC